MAWLLLKTEPSTYSFADLERDGQTTWDGVTNPLALQHLRSARAGDLCAVYHTGKEKRVVGIGRVAADAAGDVVRLAPVKPLVQPVSLDAIKKSAAFRTSPLVKMGRLSVVPLSAAQWKALLALAKTTL